MKKTYEIHVPMPYCEVWVVETNLTKKEIKKIMNTSDNSAFLQKHGFCVGEISSRRKNIKIRK